MKITRVIPLIVTLALLIAVTVIFNGTARAGEGFGFEEKIKTVEDFTKVLNFEEISKAEENSSATYRIKSHHEYAYDVLQLGSSVGGTVYDGKTEDIETVIYVEGKETLVTVSLSSFTENTALADYSSGEGIKSGSTKRINASVYTNADENGVAYIKIDEYASASSSSHMYVKPMYLGEWIKVNISDASSVLGAIVNSTDYIDIIAQTINELTKNGWLLPSDTSASFDTEDFKRLLEKAGTPIDDGYTNFEAEFELDLSSDKGATATLFRNATAMNENSSTSKIDKQIRKENIVLVIENYGNTRVSFNPDKVDLSTLDTVTFDDLFTQK